VARSRNKVLTKPAIRLQQSRGNTLYLLSLSGDELLSLADVSRVSRNGTGKLIGYQRPEVKKHVKDITQYLNGSDVLFPNSIILAFSSKARFKRPTGTRGRHPAVSAGYLEIPLPNGNGRKPAWIVDGQQRVLAISKSKRKDMQVPVSAFVTDEIETQRDQFLRVNNAKPLPSGLITELLPEIDTVLPSNMAARKVPAAVCDLLNQDPKSPFHGLVKRPSTPVELRRRAVVKDTSIVKMVENSISSPSGCLFPYRNLATGETDFTAIKRLLFTYWQAVKESFPEAWGKPPSSSRLMHGAGILAMGRLMDRIMATRTSIGPRAVRGVRREIQLVVPACHWTSGRWKELDGMAWNEIQNVARHIRVLSNLLIRAYLQEKGAAR